MGADIVDEATVKRPRSTYTLVALAIIAVFALVGCGRDSSSEESQARQEKAAERSRQQVSSPDADPNRVGDATEVGPLLVTLNDAKPLSSNKQDGGAGSQTHYYAVTDLSLENRGQDAFDAANVDYLLRDEEGYSFERHPVPDQKPPPEGQITPGGKASGQVAFDLGEEPVRAPLTLFVSLPEVKGASQGVFEFTVEHEVQKSPKPDQDAQENEEGPPPEVAGPAPGYNLIQTPDGGLSAEVPSGWGVETGADSENDGGPGSWSYFAGEYLHSSITTASSLDAWYEGPGASGAYMVASKALAQDYTDYELTHSLLHEDKEQNCTPGPYEDLDRPPYTGKVQAWFDCGLDGATSYTVAASPEGRECVVVLGARVAEEADQEAIEHIVDTFEVDCGRVTSEPLAAPPATAEATASPEATATPEASAAPAPEPPEPQAGTKHVKVVVSSDVPVDVSITDDNFDVSIGEEIVGTKTYEFDIAAESGLVVSAMNMDMRGNVSIEVYENGQLKTQDTDSSGYAQVMY